MEKLVIGWDRTQPVDVLSWSAKHRATGHLMHLNAIGVFALARHNLNSFIFLIVTLNFENSMYPWSFFYEEAKIKEGTSSKKELCKIGEEAIWESRFTCFFIWCIVVW